MSWANAVGSIFSSAASYAAAERSWKHQKEYAQNAHQWEVEDLKKAGLNPILSAGGSGAPMTTAPMANIENPLSDWTATKLAKKKNSADIDLADKTGKNQEAQSEQAEANTRAIEQQTGLERELFQFKKESAMWNAKAAQQQYENLKHMPLVYQAQIRNWHSSADLSDVSKQQERAVQPLYQTAGEAIHTARDWGKEAWRRYFGGKNK